MCPCFPPQNQIEVDSHLVCTSIYRPDWLQEFHPQHIHCYPSHILSDHFPVFVWWLKFFIIIRIVFVYREFVLFVLTHIYLREAIKFLFSAILNVHILENPVFRIIVFPFPTILGNLFNRKNCLSVLYLQ